MRFVSYTRVSTEDQADYGTGLETQEIENARFAERLSGTVVAVESDPGVSGTLYPRAGLERALKWLAERKADALLVHRVDRLGRKAYIPQIAFERIKELGARLFTVEDGEVTDENILMFSLRCGMAQNDYHRIVNNLKAGKRRLAEKGRTPSRSWFPYGYRIVQNIEAGVVRDDAGTYEIVPEQAAVVREIFTRYAAGEPLMSLCRRLHAQGIPIPRAQEAKGRGIWQPTMISRILKNTAYKGYVVWGKTKTTLKDKSELSFDERLQCRTATGRKRVIIETTPEEQVRIPVPALVSEALWEACQKQIVANKDAGGIRNDRKHLFASLMHCPNCGRRMGSAHVHYKTRALAERPILYRCKDYAPSENVAGQVCHKTQYKERDISAAVRSFFTVLVETPEFVAAAFRAYQDARTAQIPTADLEAVADALRELSEREDATIRSFTRAMQLGSRPDMFETLLREIAAERSALETRKAFLERQKGDAPTQEPAAVADVAKGYAEDMLEVLESETLTPQEKNTCLRRIIRAIVPEAEGFKIAAHPLGQVVSHEAPVTGIVTPVR